MTADTTAAVTVETPVAAPSRRARWQHRRRLPLRVTLVASMLALVAAALLVIGIAGTTLLQRYLLNRVDTQLRTSANQLRSLQWPGSGDAGSGRFGVHPGGGYYLAASPTIRRNSGGSLLMPRTSPLPRIGVVTATLATAHGGNAFTVASVSGSRKWRVLILQTAAWIAKHHCRPRTRRREQHGQPADRHRRGRQPIVLMLLAGHRLLRGPRQLRRLVEVERTAEAIAAGDLSRRVADADDRTEVGRLGTSLNGMLAQIETLSKPRSARSRTPARRRSGCGASSPTRATSCARR